METYKKLKKLNQTYKKIGKEEVSSETFSFDLVYMFPQIFGSMDGLIKLLTTYCEAVESGQAEYTAFYVDVCEILERPIKLEMLFVL